MVIVSAITLRISIVLILCVVNLTACCSITNLMSNCSKCVSYKIRSFQGNV
jgi:hypothetical protein